MAAAAPPPPELVADHQPAQGERVSDDGTVDLVWALPQGAAASGYELQQSIDPEFREAHTRYRGIDTETVITGLREGEYFFRVRAFDADESVGAWSEPLALTVRYMDRGTLYLLLATGATVAGLTIAAIISGFLKNR